MQRRSRDASRRSSTLSRLRPPIVGLVAVTSMAVALAEPVFPAAASPESPSNLPASTSPASEAPAIRVPPAAPKPTSTELSPGAPDPHPPLGAKAPDGSVPGGAALARRGLVLPAGAPPLPANITAASWILTDLDTGEVLAARDPHGRYQPASILKLLTTITVLPKLPGNRIITVSRTAAAAEGSAVGLLAGAKYTVDDLFRALMLVSGNDAAAALAEANGGVTKTVREMNAKALELGAYDTLAQTPSGLDGWQQLTSAYDMALFLRAAINEPRFVRYDRLPSATYPAKRSVYGAVGAYEFDNQSLNFLQGVPGALVAKTGFTDAAQNTYVCAATRNGHRLGLVFLRNHRYPLDQFQQASALFDWAAKLKATIKPVGVLAGPISAVDATPATSPLGSAGTATSNGPTSSLAPHVAGASARSATTGTTTATVIATVLAALLLVGGAVGLRRLRRRQLRRR